MRRSETRRELEKSLRSFLPEDVNISDSIATSKPTLATVGLGGVLTGYLWGWFRGRRTRKSKSN